MSRTSGYIDELGPAHSRNKPLSDRAKGGTAAQREKKSVKHRLTIPQSTVSYNGRRCQNAPAVRMRQSERK